MVRFIDDHRQAYGVEPICRVLPIAPSTYFRHKLLERDLSRLYPMILQAWDTFPSCLARSRIPTLVLMIFCSVVITPPPATVRSHLN
jgi:hypothetical protein